MEHHVRNFQTNEGEPGDLAGFPRASSTRGGGEGSAGKGLREKSPEGCVSNFYGPTVFFTVSAFLVPANPLSGAFVDRRTFRSH